MTCVLLAISEIHPIYIISALFLVGLGVFLVMQMRHFKRIERILGGKHDLLEMRDDLAEVKARLKGNDMERIITLLDEMLEGIRKLEQNMSVPVITSQAPESSEERDAYSDIERYLINRGFQKISYLADLTEDMEGEFKLPLEAYKNGAAYKGYVVIQDGCIVSEKITPAFEAFP